MNVTYNKLFVLPAGEYPDMEYDEYVAVEIAKGLQVRHHNEVFREWVMEMFFYNSSHPGTMFCSSFTILQDTVNLNKGILVLKHRLDV